MQVIVKEEFELQRDAIMKDIEDGAIFIHPTDTIYGIGGNALLNDVVKKIREVKQREKQPFSVIAPGKQWIRENCDVPKEAVEWLVKLPGPYTLIFKRKKQDCVVEEVAPGLDTLGVRIPDHWFSKAVEEMGFPVITTSANATDDDFMTSLDNLDIEIKKKMDFIVYEGEKKGRPSKIIDFTKEKTEIKER